MKEYDKEITIKDLWDYKRISEMKYGESNYKFWLLRDKEFQNILIERLWEVYENELEESE